MAAGPGILPRAPGSRLVAFRSARNHAHLIANTLPRARNLFVDCLTRLPPPGFDAPPLSQSYAELGATSPNTRTPVSCRRSLFTCRQSTLLLAKCSTSMCSNGMSSETPHASNPTHAEPARAGRRHTAEAAAATGCEIVRAGEASRSPCVVAWSLDDQGCRAATGTPVPVSPRRCPSPYHREARDRVEGRESFPRWLHHALGSSVQASRHRSMPDDGQQYGCHPWRQGAAKPPRSRKSPVRHLSDDYEKSRFCSE